MRRFVLAALVVGFLVGADKPKDDAKKDKDNAKADKEKELKKFQGQWVAVAWQENGGSPTGDVLKGFIFRVTDDKAIMVGGKSPIQGTISLEPSKSPYEFDLSGEYGGRKIKILGIYKFDKDQLRICYSADGGERPTKFSTKAGTAKNPLIMCVYKRVKAKTRAKE